MDISIKTFGELTILRDGQPADLPPSKLTRALFAYLLLTARPHRRDRLCEIFWDGPDDPKGALCWSLSKIRPLINSVNSERLVADRERVTLQSSDIEIDIRTAIAQVNDPSTSLNELLSINKHLKEPFLDGIDLPERDIFQQWLYNERKDIETLHCQILARLSSDPNIALTDRLIFTQQWEALKPFSRKATDQLLTQMELVGRTSEAEALKLEFTKRFQAAGIDWHHDSVKANSESGHVSEATQNITEDAIAGREPLSRQKIQFCTAKDGARIAYATIGKGLPIVKAANWFSHLEHDWSAPVWSPLFRELALDHHFIRYDERGNGLSDWNVDDISFDSFVTDLETVVDTCNVEKFALLGISQGASVSIEYAIRHPQRVSHLILFGGYAAGWRIGATKDIIKQREAIMTLTETGWGQDNPAYRQIFSSTFMPSANPEELDWFNEFQRLTTSPENAVRFLSVFGDIDVRHQLAKVSVPTLVIHSLGDLRIPVDTGRNIAATIPNAEFVGLESDGHLLLGREPASKVFIDAVKAFIRP
ncbi:alpha/beta fold hydrolase [Aliikangiella marina]|uniref:Alpha/beta fold hydrolase n=1 Tax=Aliikangiella marina TaxID=1712262 RepID=A0A545TJ55_9GAMM|nr:alpha/beta hydrolase [Aliikangiella marina]TQV77201.1 alpha/beta fold hydrolase [Aliikangiella marina]